MGVLIPLKKTRVKLPANTPKRKPLKRIPPAVKPVKSTFSAPDAATAYALAYEQWRQTMTV